MLQGCKKELIQWIISLSHACLLQRQKYPALADEYVLGDISVVNSYCKLLSCIYNPLLLPFKFICNLAVIHIHCKISAYFKQHCDVYYLGRNYNFFVAADCFFLLFFSFSVVYAYSRNLTLSGF